MIQANSLLLLLCLFCGLVVAACAPTARPSEPTHVATAATAPETVAAAESQPTDPSQKLVCKTVIPTGTRFQQRVCATQAYWDQIQKAGREGGEKAQRKAQQSANPHSP
ncbi:MAG: hypothetical protein ACT4UP_05580 [Gammaproteobacteria bacterium]